MQSNLSVTAAAALVDFVDASPGLTWSATIEHVLSRFRAVMEEQALRRALAKTSESDDERLEHNAWLRTMEHDQWTRSDEATSGRSHS